MMINESLEIGHFRYILKALSERMSTLYHRIWMFANIFLIVGSIMYIWIVRPHTSTMIISSQLLAQLAIVLFLINVNMYFIFLVIRKTPHRKVKISLATFSRYLMKWHIKIALTASFIILGHALINIFHLGPIIGYSDVKMVTGYVSAVLLMPTLVAGYLRHKKASGFRKKFHRRLAIVFVAMFFVHMLISY